MVTRQDMVKNQIIGRGIKNELVIKAMYEVPREEFVPNYLKAHAYEDRPLPIGYEQTISLPFLVAKMCEMLGLTGKETVLDIGTGSGYQAAILSKLAKEVISIEVVTELAERSKKVLRDLGYTNIDVLNQDGKNGYAEKAPYDGIISAAASATVPKEWLKQIKIGGKIVCPLGDSYSQRVVTITRKVLSFKHEYFDHVIFVPLV